MNRRECPDGGLPREHALQRYRSVVELELHLRRRVLVRGRLDVHVRHVPCGLLLPVGDAVAPRVPRQHDVSNLLCGNHGIPSVSHQLYFRLVLMQPALWSAELYLYTGVRAVDGGVRGNGRELRQVQRVAVLPERRGAAVPPKRLRGHGKQRERAQQLHLRWGYALLHMEGTVALYQRGTTGRLTRFLGRMVFTNGPRRRVHAVPHQRVLPPQRDQLHGVHTPRAQRERAAVQLLLLRRGLLRERHAGGQLHAVPSQLLLLGTPTCPLPQRDCGLTVA